MKKKNLKSKLSFDVKDLSALSETNAQQVKGGFATQWAGCEPSRDYGTCIYGSCQRGPRTECYQIP